MKHTEAQLHRAVVQYLDLTLAPEVVWSTIDHSGFGPKRGRVLKDKHVARGLPDIILLASGCRLIGIELKAPNGRPSQSQLEMQKRWQTVGATYEFCNSLEQVSWLLMSLDIPMRVGSRTSKRPIMNPLEAV